MPLTNIQYDRIFRQYEERQKENRLETERRHACVYESIPEFQKLENAVASLAVAQGKSSSRETKRLWMRFENPLPI